MTKNIPSYLRLHQDNRRAAKRPSQSAKGQSAKGQSAVAARPADPIADFWLAYDQANQLRIDSAHNGRSSKSVKASALATAATQLATSYQDSLDALRRQEAELAAYAFPAESAWADSGGVPRDQLFERLQRLLAQATAATGCQSAALYTLDETTTTLKSRAVVGLSPEHLVSGTRSLRGSRGDLEALVSDVVLIDDLADAMSTTWNSPVDFPSAMIVRLEYEDLPIGTIWFWSHERRSFSVQDAAAAQLASAALSIELANVRSARKHQQGVKSREAVRAVAQWQMRQMPPALELTPGCVVDGWAESPQSWASSWHAWDVLPDGKISLALAQAQESGMEGAMIAATARAALAAHINYRHSVTDMLARVSDSLWNTNTGDQLVSMLYAHWDPDSGEGRIASAGTMQAIIVGGRGYRPLIHGDGSPLLASRPDARWTSHEFRLLPGEALVAVNAAVLDSEHGLCQTRWATLVQEAMQQPTAPILAAIRRELADKRSPWECTGVVLHRRAEGITGFRPTAPR